MARRGRKASDKPERVVKAILEKKGDIIKNGKVISKNHNVWMAIKEENKLRMSALGLYSYVVCNRGGILRQLGIKKRRTVRREKKRTQTLRTSQDSVKPEQETRGSGLNGLINLGNTCFANCIIQVLSRSEELLDMFKEIKDSRSTVFAEVRKVIRKLRENNNEAVKPDFLKNCLKNIFKKGEQQDAHEFLRIFLESLANNSEARDESRLLTPFSGIFKFTLQCAGCLWASTKFDQFHDISLAVKETLEHSLQDFFSLETLDGDDKPTCGRCDTRIKCWREVKIEKFPDILVLHLKRFRQGTLSIEKLSQLIGFEHELHMGKYGAHRSPSKYQLYAVVNHAGTVREGHYTAVCKNVSSDEWHNYDDSRVSRIAKDMVISQKAYLLFYRRRV